MKARVSFEKIPLGEPRTLGRFSYFAASSQTIAIATGDSADIALHSADGKRLSHFRAGVADRRPTRAQYTAAAEMLSAPLTVEAQRQMSIKLMLKQPMPDVLPPYSNVVGAGDDGFWVVESFVGDPVLVVARISIAGGRQYALKLPGKARVLSGTRDIVLAMVSSDDGDERLVGFKSPPPTR